VRLDEMQRFVADAVRRESALGSDAPIARASEAVATGNARLTPVGQVDVYREQFWLRHIASLLEDYPTLEHLLGGSRGSAAFEVLCRAFLREHPPVSFSMRDLGAKMAEFLALHPDYAGDRLLADAARTEWAFIEAFDAAEAPPLDATKLAAMPEDAWPRAVLVLQPAMRRLALDYPAHTLRADVREGKKPDRPEARPVNLVVFRGQEESVRWIELEPLPFQLLEAIGRGEPLGRACESVAASAASPSASEVEDGVAGWFQAWASYGWISDVVG
jgi:hypothetical protein